MKIVSDIGGTYARFAQNINEVPKRVRKYKTSDFLTVYAALNQYCNDENIDAQHGDISIAAAGSERNNIWTITNNPDWPIDRLQFKLNGWRVQIMMNDFEAGTYALPVLCADDLKTLRAGIKKPEKSLCLLGPGTGLGLGYFHPPNIVQKTHGGHMPITCITDEQWDVVKSFQKQKASPVVFEDIVSGQNDFVKINPQLFHEFLGLFAAQSVIHGDSYGGLYLTGGIIEALVKEDRFDFDTFEQYFCFDGVISVKEDLQKTPIHIITDPNPALKGLIYAQSILDN